MKVCKRYWVYSLVHGIVAGPFKTRASAQRNMDKRIQDSFGQSLWLEIVETL